MEREALSCPPRERKRERERESYRGSRVVSLELYVRAAKTLSSLSLPNLRLPRMFARAFACLRRPRPSLGRASSIPKRIYLRASLYAAAVAHIKSRAAWRSDPRRARARAVLSTAVGQFSEREGGSKFPERKTVRINSGAACARANKVRIL